MNLDSKWVEILEGMSEIYFALDSQWRVTQANSGFYQYTNIPPEKQIGFHFLDLHLKTQEARREARGSTFLEYYQRAMNERTPVTFEDFNPDVPAWYEVRVLPNSQGGLHVFVRDIMDRKKMEQHESELRLIRKQNDLIVNAAQVGTYELDVKTKMVVSSHNLDALYGLEYSESKRPFQQFSDRIHPEDVVRVTETLQNAIKSRSVFEIEHRVLLPAGEVRWLLGRAVPSFSSDGTVASHKGFALDITKQKEMESALENSELLFSTLVNSMPQLAWIADPDGYIFWYNKGWYEYTGTTPAEMEGWGWQKVHDPTELERVMAHWTGVIRAQVATTIQFPLRGADGKFRWFLTRVTPVFDSSGKLIRWLGTNTNVDDLKQSEQELVNVLDSMSDGFFSVDKDWTITRVNTQHLKSTVLKREEQIGKNLLDLFFSAPEAKKSKYWFEYHRAMKDRVSVSFEDYYAPLDLWTTVRAFPTSDGGLAIFFTDTSAEKKVTAQVEETSRKLHLALESGRMGTWHTDLRTNIVTLSPEAKALFLIDQDELNVSELIRQRMHPDDAREVIRILNEAIVKNIPYFHEYRIIRTDGETRWLLAQGKNINDADGVPTYHSGVVQDITDRKVAEERFQEKSFEAETFRKTLHDVFMQSSAAIAICRGKDFVFELANIPYQKIVSRTEGHLLGKAMAEALPELEKGAIRAFQEVFETGEPYIVTELPATIAHEGKPTLGYYNLTVNPVFGSSGAVERTVTIGYDVTGQVTARKKAEELLVELTEALRARDEFLSIASHELKTPLTSLKLQAQIHSRAVKRKDTSAYERTKVDELINQTEKQVVRLTRLVDDMLDVSRIRTGQLNIEREPFDLAHLIHEVLGRLESMFLNSGYPLPEFTGCGQAIGEWDRMRIEQVVMNLLTNAIRYGNKKPVKVILEAESENVKIIVQDEGIGISDAAKSVIFDRFERAVHANEVSGLGLGLFITKQIVKAHGGEIWVESKIAAGSKFVVDLPKRKTFFKKTETVNIL